MNQEANSVSNVFAQSIAQVVADLPVTIQPSQLQSIISGTVVGMLQEIENREKAAAADQAPSIRECAMDYIADRQETGHCTPKTARENLAIISFITGIIADKPITKITHHDMVAVRQTLLQLPPNITKSPQYRSLSIGQILDLKPGKKMSLRSVNKYLIRFSSFLNWCCQRGYITANPFKGSQIRQKTKASAARQPFSTADLQQLFAPENFRFKPVDLWKGYIILLALTTGMRLEEICQLHCDDVVVVDGIVCIDINENSDKRLKNASSRRIIPIHSVLIEHFDFLGFVAHQGSFGKRLFPALHKIGGCYGHSYSKWFRTYRERCGVTAPGRTFHSFRHLMATNFKNQNIPVHVAAEILGHTVPGMTYGHYGKETPVEKMAVAIEQLQFGGVLQGVYLR